ncbi:hypothetical protein EEB18_019865 [Sphingopyxis sp. OPL5]|nr:hypothetical protein [Sphingopyxis sp. OPL5]QNO26944.1 hypothetical protein EEB18_019865 [Sphingopyxis sp. OPL5]
MESSIVDLVRAIVEHVDDRYGRTAAWIMAVLGGAVLIGTPVALISYLLR